MTGNCHVLFLGGWAGAIPSGYPTIYPKNGKTSRWIADLGTHRPADGGHPGQSDAEDPRGLVLPGAPADFHFLHAGHGLA